MLKMIGNHPRGCRMMLNDGETGLEMENFMKNKFLNHFGDHFFPPFKGPKVVLPVTLAV
jgi:hypothetical protein